MTTFRIYVSKTSDFLGYLIKVTCYTCDRFERMYDSTLAKPPFIEICWGVCVFMVK